MKSELYHHGIKGQKWGVRRYQNYDGTLTQKGQQHIYANKNRSVEESQNLDKWGTDAKHNILYISGISGSGKSTVALDIADETTDVIHLDSYFELKNIKEAKRNQNNNYNQFLKKNGFDNSSLNDKTLFDNNKIEYFEKVDRFAELSERFGESNFENGRKVIMEGVQLIDGTLYPNKRFFDDKPAIRLTTNSAISAKRAAERDKRH